MTPELAIDLDELRLLSRLLDRMGVLLAGHGHRWSNEDREMYELGISVAECLIRDIEAIGA